MVNFLFQPTDIAKTRALQKSRKKSSFRFTTRIDDNEKKKSKIIFPTIQLHVEKSRFIQANFKNKIAVQKNHSKKGNDILAQNLNEKF